MIAMVTVRVMQVAIDEIVDVVAVLHSFVAAARAVHVVGIMAGTLMLRRALGWVSPADLEDMLVAMCFVRMMQLPFVQIVDVIAVYYRGVPAIRAMFVRMVADRIAVLHGASPQIAMGSA